MAPSTVDSPRHITIETAIFPEQHLFPSESKKSTLDGKSMVSGSESTRSLSIYPSKKKKKAMTSSLATPADIFAQNLSDAVMDAEDSDDLEEAYVYRATPWHYSNESTLMEPSGTQHYYSSTGTESNTDGYDSFYYKEKYNHYSRRPVLRSTLSDIPCSVPSYLPYYNKKSRPFRRSNYPSDEELTPLVRRPRRRKLPNTSKKRMNNLYTLFWILLCCASVLCFSWIIIILNASPLMDVEVVGISNVLGTQKELIFNLQVRARNHNWWTIRMTNAAFSVFASSQYVPTLLNYNTSNTISTAADPAEFLGTIYHLEDPLIYQPGGFFKSVSSTATSQIQIKNPGATKDDNSGNERWSLLIRYPYELTVRGVLKYQLSPYLPYLTQLHSARVCKMGRIDPATGKISDGDRNPAKSICDDPSPVEDTDS
ncbi:hypothetical protein K501DRAFT_284429 [Backusella circina FSU 941]|nr:hypothetical protein K501DRAFT_284429 [Backusella circina FSU 941]